MLPQTALCYIHALEAAMAKKPTPVRKGIPIGSRHKINPKTGILERVENPRLSVSAKIAKRKNPARKWMAAK